MPHPNRVLLLDVDGVLITPADWFGLKIRQESPQAAAAFFEGPFLAATRGEIDLVDHLSPLIEALNWAYGPEEFLEEWHEYENHPNRLLWNAVSEVRPRFEGVYLATNQERHRMAHLLTKGGLASLVDGAFASCSVGYRKPTPEYFAQVTQRLGGVPDRIVFFDDAEENVAAAAEAGWTAHVFRGVPDFLHALSG